MVKLLFANLLVQGKFNLFYNKTILLNLYSCRILRVVCNLFVDLVAFSGRALTATLSARMAVCMCVYGRVWVSAVECVCTVREPLIACMYTLKRQAMHMRQNTGP